LLPKNKIGRKITNRGNSKEASQIISIIILKKKFKESQAKESVEKKEEKV